MSDTHTFHLKYRDTLPILDVILYPPGQQEGGTPQAPDEHNGP